MVVVLALVLANVGWWLLRGDGGASWRRSPTPVVPAPAASVEPANPAPATLPAALPPARPEARERVDGTGPVAAATGPAGLLVPVQGKQVGELHDTFGDARGSERSHEALDIMAPAGTPVLAVADGHVEKLFDSDRGGLTIYQFEPSGRWCYYYAHLQAYAPGLAEGTTLKRGQVIGYVGSTGNADPAAPHLHFAVFALTPERQWWTGTPLNPYPLLSGRSLD
jgi:murein DD-endopeptidase MepM/ murein hydrolase activator NlpD